MLMKVAVVELRAVTIDRGVSSKNVEICWDAWEEEKPRGLFKGGSDLNIGRQT